MSPPSNPTIAPCVQEAFHAQRRQYGFALWQALDEAWEDANRMLLNRESRGSIARHRQPVLA